MADTNHFRKKPVVIQAIQWDGTLSGMDSILSSFNDIRTVAKTSHPPTNTCSFWKIGTLEGGHEVSAGDFIIRGVKGEYYPCKPDIFSMTYEPATATPPADAALADDVRELVAYIDRQFTTAVHYKIKQSEWEKITAALRARAVPVADPFGDDAELCGELQALDSDIGYRAANRIGQLSMLAASKGGAT